jgi:hypothetical protein
MQPSSQPTTQPSGQPSFEPSAVPTTVPTSIPTYVTHAPITSGPTVEGATWHPTTVPTSSPTVSIIGYEDSKLFTEFLVQSGSVSLSKATFSSVFSGFFYKSTSVVGTCSEWETFYKYDLSIPFDDLYYSSMTASIGYSDILYTNPNFKSATCTDTSVIAGIVNSMNSDKSFTASCNGNIHVFILMLTILISNSSDYL